MGFHYYAAENLERAIQRCPTYAASYLYLSQLQSTDEEIGAVLEQGLQATADIEPETPPEVSPWLDHNYRDIIRLHVLHADWLLDRGQTSQAAQEYTEILRTLPQDEMRVSTTLFSLYVEHGQYDDARQMLERFMPPGSIEYEWGRLLLAYIDGGARSARPFLETALRANPYVPRLLSKLHRLVPADSVVLGSSEEAAGYLAETRPAWLSVKNIRQWLRDKGK